MIVECIKSDCFEFEIGVWLSVFDIFFFVVVDVYGGIGELLDYIVFLFYFFGFGVDLDDFLKIDFVELICLLEVLCDLGVVGFNVIGGSFYYNFYF